MEAYASTLHDVFSAYAEVVPYPSRCSIKATGILRVRGGSSVEGVKGVAHKLYSPRTRR